MADGGDDGGMGGNDTGGTAATSESGGVGTSTGAGGDAGGVAAASSSGTLAGGATDVAAGTPGAAANTAAPALLSSADILAQGRNLALAGVPLAVGGVLESVNALRAKAVGSSAEILPSIIENLGQLRSQYSGASQAVARRLGYAGGGQTVRERQKLLGGATKQYAGLIQGQQQQGIAGLNQVEGGFGPQISGVSKEPSHAINTSPFSNPAEGIGGLLGSIPGAIKAVGGLFGGGSSPLSGPSGNVYPAGTGAQAVQELGGTNIPASETTVPVNDPGGLSDFNSTTY